MSPLPGSLSKDMFIKDLNDVSTNAEDEPVAHAEASQPSRQAGGELRGLPSLQFAQAAARGL